jgi:hypothetical protein
MCSLVFEKAIYSAEYNLPIKVVLPVGIRGEEQSGE